MSIEESSFDLDNTQYSPINSDVSISSVELGRGGIHHDSDFSITNTLFIREKRQQFFDNKKPSTNRWKSVLFDDNTVSRENKPSNNKFLDLTDTTNLENAILKKNRDKPYSKLPTNDPKRNKPRHQAMVPDNEASQNMKSLLANCEKLSETKRQVVEDLKVSNMLRYKLGEKVRKYKDLSDKQRVEIEALKLKNQLFEDVLNVLISRTNKSSTIVNSNDTKSVNTDNQLKLQELSQLLKRVEALSLSSGYSLQPSIVPENAINKSFPPNIDGHNEIKQTVIASKDEIISKLDQFASRPLPTSNFPTSGSVPLEQFMSANRSSNPPEGASNVVKETLAKYRRRNEVLNQLEDLDDDKNLQFLSDMIKGIKSRTNIRDNDGLLTSIGNIPAKHKRVQLNHDNGPLSHDPCQKPESCCKYCDDNDGDEDGENDNSILWD